MKQEESKEERVKVRGEKVQIDGRCAGHGQNDRHQGIHEKQAEGETHQRDH